MDKPGYLGRLDEYEVTRVLGYGGMGMVLQAFDPSLHRFVALKVLAGHLANHPAARRRFVREARAAAAINHEHVVAVHAVHVDGPLPYLTMEYVSGVSLQQRLDQTGPLAVEEILRIGRQTALGLAAAHAQGLIHRDVKPANILLENGIERVKLTDFGLARAVDDAAMTNSGVIVGTPLYMAPEQAGNDTLDQRADLFSLGSILYAMCTGRPPFRAESSLAVLKRICEDTPRPLRDINPDIPEWLCAIIAKLHAKNPEERFQSAQEVADLLGRHLAHLQQPDRVPQPSSVRAARSRKRRWLALAVGLALVAGACWHLRAELFQLTKWETTPETKTNPAALVKAVPKEPVPKPPEKPKELPQPKLLPREQILGRPQQFKLDKLPPGEVVLLPGGRRLLTRLPDQPTVLRLLDLKTGAELYQLPGHTKEITALAVSVDGRRAVTGSEDQTVRLWDLEKGTLLHCLEGHEGTVKAVAIYSGDKPEDDKIFSASWNGRVSCWICATGEEIKRFEKGKGRSDYIIAAAFRPYGKQIVTVGEERKLRYWRLDTAEPSAADILDSQEISLATFSREGHYFAHVDQHQTLGLHRVTPTYMLMHRLAGHTAEVTGLAFSSDRRLLLSGSHDRTVRLWSVEMGRELGKYTDEAATIERVAFSTDGKHFLAVNAVGTVWLWETPS